MQTIKVFLTISLISVAITGLTGCSSMLSSKMPAGSMSMKDTYNQAIDGVDSDHSNEDDGSINHLRTQVVPLASQLPDYVDYTRTQENEIDNQFPRLPNPNVVMYIYPHQAGIGVNQTPVPGYSTVFPMYDQVYYAMPGEIIPH